MRRSDKSMGMWAEGTATRCYRCGVTDPEFPSLLASWAEAGQRVEVHGFQHHVVTRGDPSRDALLLLHGFPTCSLDFHQVLPALAQDWFVVVHDHLGFGLSDKPTSYSYSLVEQAEQALGVWEQLGVGRGHLVAHDMGTSIATELLARRQRGGIPVTLESVTFCNGSMRLDLAELTWPQLVLKHRRWGPWLARLSTEAFFKRRLRKVLADPGRLDDEELSSAWAALLHGGGRERLPAISTYLDDRIRFLPRWWEALGSLDLPCQVLWGDRDPVARPAIAEAVAAQVPGSELRWLPGVGHYPMLEAPETWAEAVLAFVSS